MKEKKGGKELASSKEAFGIIGLTLGILSLMMLGSNGILVAIVGIIFSIIQQKRYPTKIGKAAVILNSIGIIASIIFMVFLIKYLAPMIKDQLGQLGDIPLQ